MRLNACRYFRRRCVVSGRRASLHQLRKFVGRQRAAEQESLLKMAALFEQQLRLRAGLDAFGDQFKTQNFAHRDNGRGQRGVTGVIG